MFPSLIDEGLIEARFGIPGSDPRRAVAFPSLIDEGLIEANSH
jgi:hypothetical protein